MSINVSKQEDLKESELKTKEENELMNWVHRKLLSLKKRDENKFPNKIFHNAKGIGIMHIGYDELNNAIENIGKGIIFTHWKNNEKKASGPLFINVMIDNDYNKNLLNNKLIKVKDNSFIIIFKEESQIYDLCEEKKHCIKLGVDYNVECIVKDDYDGILIFEISHFSNELKSIQEDQNVNFFKGLTININKTCMHNYYNNNKLNIKDVFEGTISIPNNPDYIECERLIYEKFIMHFTEKDIKRQTLGQGIRHNNPYYMHYRKMHEPFCNVIEKINEYEIDCDLPGVDKNNIKIHFNGHNGMLEIEAHREHEEKLDDNNVHVQEIYYGKSYRRLFLPNSMQMENKNVQAKYDNGVLNVHVPKMESSQQQKYRINIE